MTVVLADPQNGEDDTLHRIPSVQVDTGVVGD
jgi:hypothetical protein